MSEVEPEDDRFEGEYDPSELELYRRSTRRILLYLTVVPMMAVLCFVLGWAVTHNLEALYNLVLGYFGGWLGSEITHYFTD